MSTCEHFTILKAFLAVHYQGTIGESYVEAGHFNLLLGSRRGFAIRNSEWSMKGRIKSGMRVVMAVYLRTPKTRCPQCRTVLVVSDGGEFFWYVGDYVQL